VIEVAAPEADGIRLLCSGGMRGAWTALSHCWGRDSFLTATTSNLGSLQSRIEIFSLPATFQDAITVTRKLGIQYLWIDSLCILQDSPEDWQAEAACMPNIYRNAHAVIVAAVGSGSHGGFLVQRLLSRNADPIQISVPFESDIGKVFFDTDFFRIYAPDRINSLLDRAWCFQEISLSHRLLMFDQIQMSFVCLEHGLFEHRDEKDPVGRDERNFFLSRF
jgi:hypothetical protein